MTDTVNLDLNEISHRRVVEVLRAAGLDLIADQYEAQLPKPTPPEPKGDVVVRLEGGDEGRSDVWLVQSAGGTGWVELGHTALSFTSWSEAMDWRAKWARGPITAYRPEPTEHLDSCIWIDPARQSGQPCFSGTRVPVATVMSLPDEAIADWYPSVTPEHIAKMRWWLAQPGVEDMLRRSL